MRVTKVDFERCKKKTLDRWTVKFVSDLAFEIFTFFVFSNLDELFVFNFPSQGLALRST